MNELGPDRPLRLLRWIVIVSIIDLILLIPLLVGVIIDWHDAAPIIGPIHGEAFCSSSIWSPAAPAWATGAGGTRRSRSSPAARRGRSWGTTRPSARRSSGPQPGPDGACERYSILIRTGPASGSWRASSARKLRRSSTGTATRLTPASDSFAQNGG